MNIEIIPAIDIIGGECVRLTQGDYSQKTSYFKDPVEVAKRYETIGVKRLHVVDLDGAKASYPANTKVLEGICKATSLDVQYGGGIKNEDALKEVFESGAKRAICGSIVVRKPEKFEEWLMQFGAGKIILGADVKEGKVAINGWEESSSLTVEELISRFLPYKLSQVICTDISKDGMLQGPSFDLYSSLYEKYQNLNITVSGGIRDLNDVRKLDELGFRSVVIGKAIYENRITLKELEKCLLNE